LASRKKILDTQQVKRKLKRICYEIYENNIDQKEIVLFGITNKGAVLAELIAKGLADVSPLHVVCATATLSNQSLKIPKVQLSTSDIEGKSIVIVDDVLNTGYTLAYVFKEILNYAVYKISTVVLLDRKHRSFPVRADIVGLTLSTTLEDHIEVSFLPNGHIEAYLV